jgi:hypothetical protein
MFSTHELDELRANREAQPRAAILAGRGAIGLSERLEDDPLLPRAGCRYPNRFSENHTRHLRTFQAADSAFTWMLPLGVTLIAFSTRLMITWRNRHAVSQT